MNLETESFGTKKKNSVPYFNLKSLFKDKEVLRMEYQNFKTDSSKAKWLQGKLQHQSGLMLKRRSHFWGQFYVNVPSVLKICPILFFELTCQKKMRYGVIWKPCSVLNSTQNRPLYKSKHEKISEFHKLIIVQKYTHCSPRSILLEIFQAYLKMKNEMVSF